MALERAFFEDVVRPDSFAVEPSFQAASPLAVEPPPVKTGTAARPAASETSYVVDRFPTAAPAPAPTTTPTASPALYNGPLNFDALSGLNVSTPDFGAYSRSAGEYRPAQLMPADPSKGFSTPYYAAYTNSGDLAGAVMVAPGQAIRLLDNKTGQVIFEGTGPEAAAQATGIANAVSEDRGRKAAWSIQADTGDGRGWVTQAYERYDPKKSGLFGTLADIALPILGTMALGPIGAALGSGVSSAAQGRSLKDSLIRAGLSYGGAQVAPYVNSALSGALAPAASGATQGALQGATQAATQAGTQAATEAAAQGAGTLLSEVVVNGVRTLVPAAVAQGIGAGAGGLAGGVLSSGGGSPPQTAQSTPSGVPTEVAEVVVQGVRNGLTIPQIVAQGIPLATVNAVLAANPVNTVAELVVQGPPKADITPVATTAAGVAGLSAALASGDPSKVGQWIKEHPLQAAGLGLTVGGALLGGAGGGGGGSFTVPGGPGTRESLSPIFSAQLPAATFGSRTPRDVWLNKRYAIQRPEAAFFSNVQPRGPERFAVPTPQDITMQGVGDVNGDGSVTEDDIAAWRASFRGYAEGGDVSDGRSDDIEARLSDGEYVIDAETVALLGNGSSRAGADALDAFRVNVRKHKGRDLARGKFTADARDPFDYLEAR